MRRRTSLGILTGVISVTGLGDLSQALAALEQRERMIRALIDAGDHRAVVDYPALGAAARLSVPTNEHFLPLLYVLALQGPRQKATYFNERLTMGGISMRSVLIEA